MKSELERYLRQICSGLGMDPTKVFVENTENSNFGDYTSNIALVSAKLHKTSPAILAKKIVAEVNKNYPEYLQSVEIADPGFINFGVKDKVFVDHILEVSKGIQTPSTTPKPSYRTVMVEYTDPNTFKVFHIGHLMANSIGEALARLTETDGTRVIRICYPSDIGLHIAKSIWAVRRNIALLPADDAPIQIKTEFLGKMYVEGTKTYEADPAVKAEIDAINTALYQRSDAELNSLSDKGKKWSLEHFDLLYNLLGTKFDETIFESDMAPIGLATVMSKKGEVFEESQGAIVFKGEKYALHTRVFVNSQGLPTYEAKELGLNVTKFKNHPEAERSIIVTASEQNEYFRVLGKVIALVDPKNGQKLQHVGHGMMRFADGKMSSRTGNVVTAEQLISDIKTLVREKMAGREFTPEEVEQVSSDVAIAAIKYTVLRSAVGSDIVFDSAASISFEGDSGPYLQYSAVRARSVLAKAKSSMTGDSKLVVPEQVSMLERLISRYGDVVTRARIELAPQHLASYLTALASSFNSYYAENTIVDPNEPLSQYRIALTRVFLKTMTDGLAVLGIKVPVKM